MTPPVYPCPRCRAPLGYDSTYRRYYCRCGYQAPAQQAGYPQQQPQGAKRQKGVLDELGDFGKSLGDDARRAFGGQQTQPQQRQAPTKQPVPLQQQTQPVQRPAGAAPPQQRPKAAPVLKVRPHLAYDRALLLYHVELTNATEVPLAKLVLLPSVSGDQLRLSHERLELALLEPGKSERLTLAARPRGAVGAVRLGATLTYYDTAAKATREVKVDTLTVLLQPPALRLRETDEGRWRVAMERLVYVEETTEEIPITGDALFDILRDVIADQHLFGLPPKLSQGDRLFRGVARFFGEDGNGEPVGVQLEVLGGSRKSKVILRAYAASHADLAGFYYHLLDQINKRTSVKEYLDEAPVIHVQGDYVDGSKTDVRDSVVQDTRF